MTTGAGVALTTTQGDRLPVSKSPFVIALTTHCVGVRVGPPLTEFSGILTGTPTYVGDSKPLMPGNANDGKH